MGAVNPLSSTLAGTSWGGTDIRFGKVTLDVTTKTGPANYLGTSLEGAVAGLTKAVGTYEGVYDQGNTAIQSGNTYTITHQFTTSVTLIIPMICNGINWTADIDDPAQKIKVSTTSNGGTWTPAIT